MKLLRKHWINDPDSDEAQHVRETCWGSGPSLRRGLRSVIEYKKREVYQGAVSF